MNFTFAEAAIPKSFKESFAKDKAKEEETLPQREQNRLKEQAFREGFGETCREGERYLNKEADLGRVVSVFLRTFSKGSPTRSLTHMAAPLEGGGLPFKPASQAIPNVSPNDGNGTIERTDYSRYYITF